MGKRFLWTTCALFVVSFLIISWTTIKILKPAPVEPHLSLHPNRSQPITLFNNYVNNVYQTTKLCKAGLDSSVFEKAITGFFNLKIANKIAVGCSVVTIIDLTRSSCSKRMWIVDLKKARLLLNTWVAHGEGSGDDVPYAFSNDENSYQSSLGFYVTGNTYHGKHGLSLKLHGMDEGFNDMANKRDIVVHAANYVSPKTIKILGRLGRSQGCPAVSPKVITKVINDIKGGTVMFVNGNDANYTSKYLDSQLAARVTFSNGAGQPMTAAL